MAASGLEWTPASHSRWPPAVRAAIQAAFGAAIGQPPQPAAAAGAAGGGTVAASPGSRAAGRAAIRQLPAEVQERIAAQVVRPLSAWLRLEGGALGDPLAISGSFC